MSFALDLDGRRALVTGAGQGVGKGVAEYLAQAGAELFINDVRPDRAELVAGGITASGGVATAVPFDVTDAAAAAAALAGLAVDIVVNNAGNAGTGDWGQFGWFVDSDPESWQRFIDVNLYGPMNVTHAVLPGMIARGWGRVITIVSDAGRVGEQRMAAYCTAKAGAAGFTRAIAREGGRYAITANNIALGSMRPDSDEPTPADDPALKHYVIRRFGRPSDVAGMALYLASDLSAWVTGQTLAVNGGYSFSL